MCRRLTEKTLRIPESAGINRFGVANEGVLGERQTENYLPVIRMGERGSCRAWFWFGRSLALPVLVRQEPLPPGINHVAARLTEKS